MLPPKEEIGALIAANAGIRAREIAENFSVPESDMDRLFELLTDLQIAGEVIRMPEGGWKRPGRGAYRVGLLSLSQRGDGYVRGAKGEEYYVPRDALAAAVPGDWVFVKGERKASSGRGRLPLARVVDIVKRTERVLRGTFHSLRKGGVVEVRDRSPWPKVVIPGQQTEGARDGEKVLIKLLPAVPGATEAEGRVLHRLVDDGSLASDIEAIRAEFELPSGFPPEVEAEARAAKAIEDNWRWPDRVDLRATLSITIDPHDARDFDDAVSLEEVSAGEKGGARWKLGVHIADVSHYVTPGSHLDREARRRGTSVYLPGAVIPMLPERLCNDLCSLRPLEDRLAKTVFLTFDKAGTLLETEIVRSVIRSHRRFTYEEVLDLLEGRTPREEEEHADLLFAMADLRGQLLAKRKQRGSLELDLPKLSLVTDDDGSVTALAREERDIAHNLIEEFMLAANEAVAAYFVEKRLPLAARHHPRPDEERFADFKEFLEAVDVDFKGGPEPHDLQGLVRQIADDPIAAVIQLALLRTMGHAEYALGADLHFALATSTYCHFTSPIRRFPDLLVHQVLDDHLKGELTARDIAELKSTLPPDLERSSDLERTC